MSLWQHGTRAMGRIFTLLLIYFTIGPAYYSILDALHDQAVANGGSGLTIFIAWMYPTMYYGFPTLIVLGIIFSIIGFYGTLRRKYYATEEVGYYSS